MIVVPSLRGLLGSGGAFSPSQITGLSLWLKADAGVTTSNFISQIIITGFTGIYTALNDTYNFDGNSSWWGSSSFYINSDGALIDDNDGTVIATNNNNFQGAWTPANYFSTITLSNAGEDVDQGVVVVNGIYTRSEASGPFGNFTASGGRIINFDDNDSGWWSTIGDYYRNYGTSLNVGDWVNENGEEPAPTAVNSTSARNVGSPTSTIVILLNVDEWADQSVNGNNATARTGNATLVSSVINGKPVLRFDGTANLITNDFFVNNYNTPITIIAVSKASASTVRAEQPTARYIYGVTNGGGYDAGLTYGAYGTEDPNFSVGFGISYVSGQDIESSPMGEGEVGISSSINSGTLISAFLNGTLIGTADPLDQSTGYDSTGQFSIGSEVTLNEEDNFFCTCDIAEIIIYNRALTTPERQQVEAYLNTKYEIY